MVAGLLYARESEDAASGPKQEMVVSLPSFSCLHRDFLWLTTSFVDVSIVLCDVAGASPHEPVDREMAAESLVTTSIPDMAVLHLVCSQPKCEKSSSSIKPKQINEAGGSPQLMFKRYYPTEEQQI
ncbi:unnamed protein product [Phytophthora lilii]|uniref:Unnamed protein product n=1 Tax=Phytophthora lilii TaxID=2077276 RepID=A0A9W6X3Y1_9STRA|nr:unnamed protein product [Phytophthora lilii]